MRAAAFLAALLVLGAAGATSAAHTPPDCKEAWAQIPPTDRTYDFARDARVTRRGNEGYATFRRRLPRRACQKEWTVLLYLAADNDLAKHAVWQLREMEAAPLADGDTASGPDADVIAQLDVPAPAGIRRLHLFHAPDGHEAAPGGAGPDAPEAPPIRSPIVSWLPEERVAPGESLRRFLSWAVAAYPSRHYLVSIAGHGRGWRPAVAAGRRVPYDRDLRSGGIALDDHPGTVLDGPSLRAALLAASRERLGGRPFDIYLADACLMQTVEVTTELAGAARYLVGSEQVENYLGHPYRLLLPRLNRPPAAAPAPCPSDDVACGVAALLPAWAGQVLLPGGLYAAVDPAAAETFTFSSLDAGALAAELAPALHRLGDALRAYVREDPGREVALEGQLSPPILCGGPDELAHTPDFQGGQRDVGILLDRIEGQLTAEVGAGPPSKATQAGLDALAQARAALGRTIVASRFGTGYRQPPYRGMAGVSIWVPEGSEDYHSRQRAFASSRFYREGSRGGGRGFGGFLDVLYRR